jgi:hypothetical protein
MAVCHHPRDDSHPKNSTLPVIECTCGAEILLVPDVKAMAEAVEHHVSEHQKNHGLSNEEAESVRDHLIVQTFEVAAKIEK